MLLGLFLSMWINNHTAPIICVSFLTPIMQDFGKDSRFNRALMLGLTFGCNFGGMVTPIASLHNVLAVSALAAVGIEVSFGSWMLVAVPFSLGVSLLC
jgi:di/tricarboxylate transporter